VMVEVVAVWVVPNKNMTEPATINIAPIERRWSAFNASSASCFLQNQSLPN